MVLSQILGASQNQNFSLRPKNKSQIRNRVGSRSKRRNSINSIFDAPENAVSNQSFKRKLSDNASSLRMKGRRQTTLCQIKESKFGKEKDNKNNSGISQHEHQEVSFRDTQGVKIVCLYWVFILKINQAATTKFIIQNRNPRKLFKIRNINIHKNISNLHL